jgi:AcrR family transcriptional regulator
MKPRARVSERIDRARVPRRRAAGAAKSRAANGGKEARAKKPPAASASRSTKRTRRSASEARQRILEAAQRQLVSVGPEALRLTDLARQLSVSHPAILHHFGSREGLVAAVVRHSFQVLSAELIQALNSGERTTDRLELVEMVAKVCGEDGLARLLAWLLLSGREAKLQMSGELPLKQLADAAHTLRSRFNHPASYEDTLFEVQLLSIVLLGDAILGDAVRRASGVCEGEPAAREFRRRLTRLLPS